MLIWNNLNQQQRISALARPALTDSAAVQQTVVGIISDVREQGDTAVLSYTQRFDCESLTSLVLTTETRDSLATRVPDDVRTAIDIAFTNIKKFHEAQRPSDIAMTTSPGVICEQRFAPLDCVGLYIPGGSAPLPSTVLMLGVPSLVAENTQRILCTPPDKHGEIAPEIAYAAQCCGIDAIFLCGGAQAIAAMALGTQSIPKADKIFGPGNSYVTQAKQQVSLIAEGAAIDMPAGPSEVLVLADESANPAFIASDLLSQAEHGVDSQAILVCSDQVVIEKTLQEVEKQLTRLSRATIARESMQHARYILTASIEEAVAVSNQYAPEHLIVQTQSPEQTLISIKNAGSVFLGAWSPESAGDYASGTNHVLPTYGYARNYSSLGLADFMRRYTVQTLSKDGLRTLGPAIMSLAAAEGLDAHEQAVRIRLDALEKGVV